jgi:hypothetical protein
VRVEWRGERRGECRKEESVKWGESREGGIRDRSESRMGGGERRGECIGRRNLCRGVGVGKEESRDRSESRMGGGEGGVSAGRRNL